VSCLWQGVWHYVHNVWLGVQDQKQQKSMQLQMHDGVGEET